MNTDRLLQITIVLSLIGHAAVLGAEMMMPGWGQWSQAIKPLKLIYEPEKAPESSQLAKSLGRAHDGMKEITGPSALMPSSGSLAEGYRPQSSSRDASTLISQITVGSVMGTGGSSLGSGDRGAWETAIDLTNLAAAAQGNPVLYSYFGAIREQIQQTANTQNWLPQGASDPGTAYVGFIVSPRGTIESTSVVPERSVDSPLLQRTALGIVKASGPFPPFPPSFTDDSMAIVVPIEFAESVNQ